MKLRNILAAFAAATLLAACAHDAPAPKAHIYRVYFATGSAAIGNSGYATINDAVKTFHNGTASEVIVAGHADGQGGDKYNLILSEKRAAAVRTALQNAGVPPEKINGRFFGERQPLVSTSRDAANASNRRVLIVVR